MLRFLQSVIVDVREFFFKLICMFRVAGHQELMAFKICTGQQEVVFPRMGSKETQSSKNIKHAIFCYFAVLHN